jgi:hypothetical protein
MSEPISVGDRVLIWRGHRCDIGKVFVVAEVKPANRRSFWTCPCGAWEAYSEHWVGADTLVNGYGAPISWVKKLPPISDPERVERREELTA